VYCDGEVVAMVKCGEEGHGENKSNGAPHHLAPEINPLMPKISLSAARLLFRSVVPPYLTLRTPGDAPRPPLAGPSSWLAPGDYRPRAGRNPSKKSRRRSIDGLTPSRSATRLESAEWNQEPPRMARLVPLDDPRGSVVSATV
jgi:hypothetical protein